VKLVLLHIPTNIETILVLQVFYIFIVLTGKSALKNTVFARNLRRSDHQANLKNPMGDDFTLFSKFTKRILVYIISVYIYSLLL